LFRIGDSVEGGLGDGDLDQRRSGSAHVTMRPSRPAAIVVTMDVVARSFLSDDGVAVVVPAMPDVAMRLSGEHPIGRGNRSENER
jgi:hypothetical protein